VPLADSRNFYRVESIVKYLSFLQALVNLGDKLPAILAELEIIAASIGRLTTLVTGELPAGTLGVMAADPEEEQAEAQIAAIVAGPNAAFDGSKLRGLFKLLKDSGALDVLVSLLLSKATGG
jgi:hypothetical protein